MIVVVAGWIGGGLFERKNVYVFSRDISVHSSFSMS